MPDLAAPQVPVSWGELLDKIAILEIKQRCIAEPAARANVARELAALSAIAAGMSARGIASLLVELRRVNELLWDIEDAVRREDAHGRFGAEFVRLARQVYRRNDERAAIKRAINERLGSELIEEKSYAAGLLRAIPPNTSAPTGRPESALFKPAGNEDEEEALVCRLQG